LPNALLSAICMPKLLLFDNEQASSEP